MDLKKRRSPSLKDVDAARLPARLEHVDARHQRVRAGERPACRRDRPPLLQPGERDEAARNRPRRRDEQGSHRDLAQARRGRLNKVGVVVGNCFGFVANRMLAYYMREAYLLLEEGASVPQIDKVLTDFGLPVGPVRHAGHRRHRRRRAHPPVSEVDRQDAGGRAAVGGAGSAVRDGPLRAEDAAPAGIATSPAAARGSPIRSSRNIAAEAAAKRGITRRAVTDDEIIARITTALANEGAQVLEEGYAIRASDIDVIYCHGFGFPRHRGGPMFYADTVGPPDRPRARAAYREQFGDYWKPSPRLERLVAEGRGSTADVCDSTASSAARRSSARSSARATGSPSRRSASTRSRTRRAITSGSTSIRNAPRARRRSARPSRTDS